VIAVELLDRPTGDSEVVALGEGGLPGVRKPRLVRLGQRLGSLIRGRTLVFPALSVEELHADVVARREEGVTIAR